MATVDRAMRGARSRGRGRLARGEDVTLERRLGGNSGRLLLRISDGLEVPAVVARERGGVNARLEWLEGLGHFPQEEDPERVADALLPFLSELNGSAE